MQPVPPQDFFDAQDRIANKRVHAVVELAHAAGCRVARIDKRLFAFGALRDQFTLPFIQRFKVGAAHVDLAADFHDGRSICR